MKKLINIFMVVMVSTLGHGTATFAMESKEDDERNKKSLNMEFADAEAVDDGRHEKPRPFWCPTKEPKRRTIPGAQFPSSKNYRAFFLRKPGSAPDNIERLLEQDRETLFSGGDKITKTETPDSVMLTAIAEDPSEEYRKKESVSRKANYFAALRQEERKMVWLRLDPNERSELYRNLPNFISRSAVLIDVENSDDWRSFLASLPSKTTDKLDEQTTLSQVPALIWFNLPPEEQTFSRLQRHPIDIQRKILQSLESEKMLKDIDASDRKYVDQILALKDTEKDLDQSPKVIYIFYKLPHFETDSTLPLDKDIISGIDFRNCKQKLRSRNLKCLCQCILADQNLQSLNLSKASFTEVDVTRTSFNRTNLTGAIFKNVFTREDTLGLFNEQPRVIRLTLRAETITTKGYPITLEWLKREGAAWNEKNPPIFEQTEDFFGFCENPQ